MGTRAAMGRIARAAGGRWLPLTWGAGVALAVMGLCALGAFEPLEHLFTDMHFAWRGELPPSGEVVVVGVSPQCTRRLGRWPWPRRYHAQLIEKLAQAGARVICFDIYFSAPSRDVEDDEALAEAARRAGRVVLPVYKRDRLGNNLGRRGPLLRVRRMARNLPVLSRATLQGHINVRHDQDGIVRRVPAGLECKGQRYYQLGLLAAASYLGVASEDIGLAPRSLSLGHRRVPVDSSGSLLVNYCRLPDQTRPYFVSRILAGKVDPEVFRGKVVFVGQTNHGLQNADVVVTPEGNRFGVFVQATVADNVISGRMLRRLHPLLLGLVVLALSLACSRRLFARRAVGKVAWSVGFAAAAVLVSHFTFERFHVLLDVAPCLAAVAGCLGGALVAGIVAADREVERRDLEMETLLAASRASSEEGELGVPAQIAASIGGALGVEGCALFRLRDGQAELAASYGFQGQLPGDAAAAASAQALRWVVRERRPFCAHGKEAGVEDRRVRCVLILPLLAHGELHGALALYNKCPSAISPHKDFTKHDLRLLALLSQQAALTMERASLADHLRGALGELERAQQQLIESERLSAVGKMANMVIHDIKSPMQGIRMLAEMAADDSVSAEDRHEFSTSICREIDRLVEMCQEILDFARGTTSLAGQNVAADEFLAEFLLGLEPECQQKGVRLESDLRFQGTARLDVGRMKRAVANLCRNALEAMVGSGGTLRIATRGEDGCLRIDIADTGPGIPEEIVDTLFEPFVTQGKDHGTGLGLAIVKKVVEDHQGRINVASRPGQGTAFTIRLPVASQEHTDAPEHKRPAQGSCRGAARERPASV
ncbi:MAG: CHASE2 domain-containing protein [bacterium]